jgi:polysaccharide export outer membrane protein
MKMKSILSVSLLLLAGAVCLAGQSEQQNLQPVRAPETTIGPEDSITIVALESDEISKTWRVNSSGDIDLPLVGKMHAAGLTTSEFEEQLSSGLSKYVRDPQVSVFVAEFRSRSVTVAGAVHHPGPIEISSGTTLLTILQLAGGLDGPGPTLIVTREAENGPIPLPAAIVEPDTHKSSVEITIKEVTDPTTAASRLEIKPHDVISVLTQKRLVYVIGEVNRPGAVELATQNTVSVMQVLAAAGGLTKVAAPGKTQIMRLGDGGVYARAGTVDLKAVMTGKHEDRLLSTGDILVVPSSNLKSYTQTTANSAISTGVLILTRF